MFVGREKELQIIEKKISSDNFEFGIIYGRRRIGKTRLLQEVVIKHNAIYYVANEMGLDYNLNQFGKVIASYFDEPISFTDFESVFKYLAKRSMDQKLTIIIDEFTYLISSNSEILSIFQNIIDQFLLNSNLKLILSGSHVGMVEDALTYKKPLYGRSTFKLKLEPFDYYEASSFYEVMSAEDKVRLYSIFGGVPFYASKIDASKSVKQNVIDLILDEGAIFEDEITFFLSQEVRSVATYGRILNAIASGATKLNEIASKSGTNNSGTTSKYLDVLMMLGIVEKETCFGEKSNSKKTLYKIKDQLFKFHFTFMEKNRSKKVIMNSENFYETFIAPHLDTYVSLEFETVCKCYLMIVNRDAIQEIGRFWYNDSKKRLDIEIDIVMRTHNKLTIFECKWTNDTINKRVLDELEKKGDYIKSDGLGFFSRKGYTVSLERTDALLYTVEDLYFQ